MGTALNLLQASTPQKSSPTPTAPIQPTQTTGGTALRLLQGQAGTAARQPVAETESDNKIFSGGIISKIADLLSVGQYAAAGGTEKLLEKVGTLETRTDRPSGIIEGVKQRKSFIDVLKRVGGETGKGGLLTGTYTPSESVWSNFVREIPVTAIGLAGDIILDPLMLLSKAGKFAKGTEYVGKVVKEGTTLARTIPAVQKVWDVIERVGVPRGGQLEAFKDIDRAQIRALQQMPEDVNKLVATVIDSPKVVQQRLNQILRGGITTKEAFADLVAPLRKEIDDAGLVLADLSDGQLLDPRTWAKNKGTYVGNFFRKYVPGTSEFVEAQSKSPITGISRPVRIKTQEFTPREDFAEPLLKRLEGFFDLSPENRAAVVARAENPDLPPLEEGLNKIAKGFASAVKDRTITKEDILAHASVEKFRKFVNEKVRKSLGQIQEAGPAAALTLEKVKKATIRTQFFNDLVEKGIAKDLPDDAFRFQLPSSKSFGQAAGKFVREPEFHAIMEQVKEVEPMTRIWKKALEVWKTSKTALNPATIARNDIANFLLLNPLGGVSPHRIDLYWKAMQEWSNGTEMFQRFRKAGGGLSSQAAAELNANVQRVYQADTNIRKFFSTPEKFYEAAKKFYGNQDTFFKFANFIKGTTEDGLSDLAAMQRANFYLVDYAEVPEMVKWLRNSPIGAPFISFTYGVSKPLAKTLLEQPHKLANYFKVLRAMQSMGGDIEVDESALPKQLQGQPYNALKLPFRDKNGQPQFLDMRFLLPFNILEPMSRAEYGIGTIPVAGALIGQNPVAQITASLLTNRNPFTGNDIVPPGSTPGEARMAMIDFVQKQLLPAFSPGIPTTVQGQAQYGGTSFDKMVAAIQGRPDFSGRDRDIFQTILDVFAGLKITPYNEELQKRLNASDRRKALEEYRKQLNRALLSKTLLPEEKEAQVLNIRQKIEALIAETIAE